MYALVAMPPMTANGKPSSACSASTFVLPLGLAMSARISLPAPRGWRRCAMSISLRRAASRSMPHATSGYGLENPARAFRAPLGCAGLILSGPTRDNQERRPLTESALSLVESVLPELDSNQRLSD